MGCRAGVGAPQQFWGGSSMMGWAGSVAGAAQGLQDGAGWGPPWWDGRALQWDEWVCGGMAGSSLAGSVVERTCLWRDGPVSVVGWVGSVVDSLGGSVVGRADSGAFCLCLAPLRLRSTEPAQCSCMLHVATGVHDPWVGTEWSPWALVGQHIPCCDPRRKPLPGVCFLPEKH